MALIVEICKRLGDFTLEVSFSAGGERLALLGASGSGKTVTLRCIAGVLTPDRGHIELDGTVFYDSARSICLPPQTRHTGFLFQHYALFPNMTVRQNLLSALPDRKTRRQTADSLLRRFQLEEVARLRPRQLSGGQRQRAALARMLASRPRIVLLDEPFSALDTALQARLELELLDVLDPFPGPVLWVSHNLGEVYRTCSRVCVLDRGRSQGVTGWDTLFRNPGSEAAARLSGCQNVVAALPRGQSLFLPDWNLTLQCSRPVPPGVTSVGIRSRQVRIGAPGDLNACPCRVERVIRDLDSTTLILRPLSGSPDAPPLRMEPDRALCPAPGQELTAVLPPEDILLLKSPD